MKRKGMGINMGKGYKNIIIKDPLVHSMSAKGMKQKNPINPVMPKKKTKIADTIKNPPTRKFLARDIKGKWGYAINNMADIMFKKGGEHPNEYYILPDGTKISWRDFDGVDDAVKKFIIEKDYERYAENELKSQNSSYKGNDLMQVQRYERVGSKIYGYYSPEQAKYRDIERGKHKINGLKLSQNQAYGNKPKYEDYYNKDVEGLEKGEIYRKGFKDPIARKYHKGLIVKMSGDYDPSLRSEHNTWAIIDEVIDPYHFKVIQEDSNKKLTIRDTDVKWWIGDTKYDYIGVGKERHKSEILPTINAWKQGKSLKGD